MSMSSSYYICCLLISSTFSLTLFFSTFIKCSNALPCAIFSSMPTRLSILWFAFLCTCAVWRSGNTLVSINEVYLRWARLVLGCVTVSGFDSRRWHFISVCNQPPRSTQPSALRGTVKWITTKGRWCSATGKVTASLEENNDSLPPGGWRIVTCGLTACRPNDW